MQSNIGLYSLNAEISPSSTSSSYTDPQTMLNMKSPHQDLLHKLEILEQRTKYQIENSRLHTQIQLLEMQRKIEDKRMVENHGYVQQQYTPPPIRTYTYPNHP